MAVIPDNPPLPSQRCAPSVAIEEVPDRDDPDQHWIEDFPKPAGLAYATSSTTYKEYQELQTDLGNDQPWAPFQNQNEWELVRWLMTAGVSQKKIDDFLKLKLVG